MEQIFLQENLLIRYQRKRVASAILCWISGLGEAHQGFLKLDLKNLIQKLRGGTNSPCLLRLQTRKFLCRKITARFKLNLKTDGPDCKIIFKFGSRVERLHSARKQCRRIYICLFCVAKRLLGDTQTLELHLLDAGLASPNEKVYGSNTLSGIGKKLFTVTKENSDD